jgi:hypothetical protein
MSGPPGPSAEIARSAWALGAGLWGLRHEVTNVAAVRLVQHEVRKVDNEALGVKAYPFAELSVLIFEDYRRHRRC